MRSGGLGTADKNEDDHPYPGEKPFTPCDSPGGVGDQLFQPSKILQHRGSPTFNRLHQPRPSLSRRALRPPRTLFHRRKDCYSARLARVGGALVLMGDCHKKKHTQPTNLGLHLVKKLSFHPGKALLRHHARPAFCSNRDWAAQAALRVTSFCGHADFFAKKFSKKKNRYRNFIFVSQQLGSSLLATAIGWDSLVALAKKC